MRISDWSSDVCSSDLCQRRTLRAAAAQRRRAALLPGEPRLAHAARHALVRGGRPGAHPRAHALPPPGSADLEGLPADGGRHERHLLRGARVAGPGLVSAAGRLRSEEHTSELTSLMRISYAV